MFHGIIQKIKVARFL